MALVRKSYSKFRKLIYQKFVRNLSEDSSAISSVLLGARRSPMSQASQDFESVGYDIVGETPFYIGYKADAARLVFVVGVVKALCPWLFDLRVTS